MARSNLIPNAFIWETSCIKYQKPSWPVTFYPRPLIWTATHLSKHLFLRNHWAVWWIIHYIVLVTWPKCLQSPYMVKQIGSIISCSWLWPILTLLRRSGERLRTFRSSSLKILSGTLSVSNSLDTDQDQNSVGPDLSQNCLQRVLADEKSLR